MSNTQGDSGANATAQQLVTPDEAPMVGEVVAGVVLGAAEEGINNQLIKLSLEPPRQEEMMMSPS